MKEASVDTVDDGAQDKEVSLEKEYQRVSISGEEKCGVRSHFVRVFIDLFIYLVLRLST